MSAGIPGLGVMLNPQLLGSLGMLQGTLQGGNPLGSSDAIDQQEQDQLHQQAADAARRAQAAGQAYQSAAASPIQQDPTADFLSRLGGGVAGVLSGNRQYLPAAEQRIQEMHQQSLLARQQNLAALRDTYDQQAQMAERLGQTELAGQYRMKYEQVAKMMQMVADAAKQGEIGQRQSQLETQKQQGRIELQGAKTQGAKEVKKTMPGGTQLSPEAIEANADYFNHTHQLPPMGMGQSGLPSRIAIMNRAAQKSGGGDLATNVAQYAGDKASLKNLQEQSDAVESFSNTALKNYGQFLDTMKNVTDTGSPVFNQPLRNVDLKLLGSGDVAAFRMAATVIKPEFARIMSSPSLKGQLTDNARHEMEGIDWNNATMNQVLRVGKILMADNQNRRSSLADQIATVRGRIGTPEEKQAAGPAKTQILDAISRGDRDGALKLMQANPELENDPDLIVQARRLSVKRGR